MNKLARIIGMFKKVFFLIRLYSSGEYAKAKLYANYYGVQMGKNVKVTGTLHFPTEAFLIEIGDNVTLTNNVTFHTHDGGVGVLREKHKGINVFGRIKIGNNVFIGSGTTILPNIVIGNNVVIGAGSVITKNVADNVVVAGNPARVIRTMEEYEQKALKTANYIHSTSVAQRKQEILNSLNSR